MDNFLRMLLECTLTMSVIALVLLLVTPAYTKRYSAKSAYLLWVIVMLGFLIPFRPTASQPALVISLPAQQVVELPANQRVPSVDTIKADLTLDNTSETAVLAGNTQRSATTATTPAVSLTVMQIVALVYGIGVIVTLLWQAVRYHKFLRVIKRWRKQVVGFEYGEVLQQQCQLMGIKENVDLYICPAVDSPLLVGVLRPGIYLPDASLNAEELALILRHELTHYRRHDLWNKLLMLFASALHWFNPLMYFVGRAMDFQCEASCDAEVTKNLTLDTRQYYSETIISVIRPQRSMTSSLSTSFAGGKKEMKQRIGSIMDIRKKRAGVIALSLVLIITCCTGLGFALSSGSNVKTYATDRDYTTEELQALIGTKAVVYTASGVAAVYGSRIDYEKPYALYMNGCEVVIDKILWADGLRGYFAHITLGTPLAGGNQFSVPLKYLAAVDTLNTTVALPGGVLQTTEANQYITVYKYDSTQSGTAGIYMAGTKVELLGQLGTWYNIRIEDTMGFVSAAEVKLEGDFQKVLAASQPDSYSGKGVLYTVQYEDYLKQYRAKTQEVESQKRSWTLEENAWLSKLRESYGIDDYDEYHILPGAGDISQTDALALGRKYFMELTGLDAATVDTFDVSYGFYTIPYKDPEAKMWMLNFNKQDDSIGLYQSYYVRFASPSGEILQQSSKETALREPSGPRVTATPEEKAANKYSFTEEHAKLLARFQYEYGPMYKWSLAVKEDYAWHDFGGGNFTQPKEGEITQNQALAAAKTELMTATGMTDQQLAEYDPYYFFEQTHIRNWRIDFYLHDKEAQGILEGYSVRLLAKDGTLVNIEPVQESYTILPTVAPTAEPTLSPEDIEARRKFEAYEKALQDWEKEHGQFYTWSLELKHDFSLQYPDSAPYGLPGEGDLTQQQAYDIAVKVLKEQEGFTDKMIDERAVFYYFETKDFMADATSWVWRVDFYTHEELTGPVLTGYTIILDSVTGEVLHVYTPYNSNG